MKVDGIQYLLKWMAGRLSFPIITGRPKLMKIISEISQVTAAMNSLLLVEVGSGSEEDAC